MAVNFKQNPDGTAAFHSEQEGFAVGRVGGPKTPTSGTGVKYRGATVSVTPLTAVTASPYSGAVAAVQLDAVSDVIILNTVIYISTTTPACTLECGTAASSSTQSNNLIDGLVTTASGVFDNITDKGASGKSRAYLTAGQYVTVSSMQSCGTLAGNLYIEYVQA